AMSRAFCAAQLTSCLSRPQQRRIETALSQREYADRNRHRTRPGSDQAHAALPGSGVFPPRTRSSRHRSIAEYPVGPAQRRAQALSAARVSADPLLQLLAKPAWAPHQPRKRAGEWRAFAENRLMIPTQPQKWSLLMRVRAGSRGAQTPFAPRVRGRAISAMRLLPRVHYRPLQ